MTELWSGLILGLAAGVSPGPLLTLVVQQTMRHGVREGVKVAAVPLITDVPVVAATMVVVRAGNLQGALGAISLAGAAFLVYLAYESFTEDLTTVAALEAAPRSVQKGVLANLLNPHPYLFWATVGATFLQNAWAVSVWNVVWFLLGCYGALVGSKVAIAMFVGSGRDVLRSRWYALLARALGVALLGFAVRFARDGVRYLGWWP